MESQHSKLTKNDIDKATEKKTVKDKTKRIKNVPLFVLHIVEILIGVAYVVLLAFGRLFLPQDNEFFQSFNIFSGANPMPNARLLSYALLVIIIGTLIRILIKFVGERRVKAKKKGGAILSLLSNLVKYVIVIIVICFALNALGVDATAILAGLGILTLVIGLGVTSLIEDIVAGIFIIAEGLFDVGDIVVIDGFRGTIVTIGVRSTKLADVGGDILTLRNSSIGSVINLTDRQSCAAVSIPIAPEESLSRVEEVIKNNHIEAIRETCDKMVGDPIYLGLCEITPKGVQMLLFIAACNEADRYDVERALYHGLKTIFDENDIKLGNPGVLVTEEN